MRSADEITVNITHIIMFTVDYISVSRCLYAHHQLAQLFYQRGLQQMTVGRGTKEQLHTHTLH